MYVAPFVAALLAGASVLAGTPQQPDALLHGLRVPIHTAADDLGLPYGVWAAGADYKASFHGDVTFVPYLGGDYPENQPWSWRTTSVRVGERELLATAVRPSEPQRWHDGFRYEYRHAAFTEAYDVRAEGLEQTFVFDRLPVELRAAGPLAAGDDLIIRGAVTSGLTTAETTLRHGALVFEDAFGRPITSYGAAFAVDAAGRRTPLATGYRDGAIELRVPASWLATAHFPIVVDPLLSVSAISFVTSPAENVDIARDDIATTDNVMVTLIRRSSASDGDVFAGLTDDGLGTMQIVFSDITTTWSSDDAACAFVAGTQRWAIVLQRYFGSTSPTQSRLRGHAHDSGNLTLSTGVASLITSATRNEWRPAVGGVAVSGNHALVAFQSEDNGSGNFVNTSNSAVWGVRFDTSSGNGAFGAEFVIRTSTVQDHERPSVNKVAIGFPGPYGWVCMMQVYNPTIAGDDWDLIGKYVNSNGTVTAGGFVPDIANANTHHQLGPIVEGSGERYAVLFTTENLSTTPFKTQLVSGRQVRIERFDWAPGASAPTAAADQPDVILASAALNPVYEVACLGYDTVDESHFAAAWRTIAPASPTLRYARTGYDGGITEGPATLFDMPGQAPELPGCVFDDDHQTFLFAYGIDSGAALNALYGNVLVYASGPAPTIFAASCSGATIEWVGSQQIGSEFCGVQVTNNTGSIGHFLVASLGTSFLPVVDPAVMPGCTLLVQASGPAYLATLPFQFGTVATWNLSLPSVLGPLTLHFQDWLFAGTQFTSSSRLTVPLLR
ncbi:MAG: hypothetical protein KDE27_12785 [Planctomycetes bacterium]|nr:hypothetical protein [Planctomycetota bacterium]